MKCVNCANCIGMIDGYYMCRIGEGIDLVEECIANDETMKCELYVEDSNDDFTA